MPNNFYLERNISHKPTKPRKKWVNISIILAWIILIILKAISAAWGVAENLNKQYNRFFDGVFIGCIVVYLLFNYKRILHPPKKIISLRIDDAGIDFLLDADIQGRIKIAWKDLYKVQINFGFIRLFTSSNHYKTLDLMLFSKTEIAAIRKSIVDFAEQLHIQIEMPSSIRNTIFEEKVAV